MTCKIKLAMQIHNIIEVIFKPDSFVDTKIPVKVFVIFVASNNIFEHLLGQVYFTFLVYRLQLFFHHIILVRQ